MTTDIIALCGNDITTANVYNVSWPRHVVTDRLLLWILSFPFFPSLLLYYSICPFFPSPFFLTPTPISMLPFPYFFLFLLFPIILFELKRFISAQQPKQVSRLRIERNIKENVGRDVERERESGRWGRMRGGGITRVRRER